MISFGRAMVWILCVAWCAAPAAAQDSGKKADAYLRALMETQPFAGSVLIAKGDAIILEKGYGFANVEHRVANNPDTVFRLASVTKQFTALAIMQLKEQKKLSVEDTVSTYVEDFPAGDRVTIHHLLTHTSGIQNFTALVEWRRKMRRKMKLKDVIDIFRDKELEFTPGEKFKYSNSGYVLLGAIIELVSDQDYEAYLKENIFKPLGMKHTGFEDPRDIVRNRAQGYAASKGALVNAPFINMTSAHGAGALYSTVRDMLRWHRALNTEALVSKATLKEIFTPDKQGYGYGWGIGGRFGHRNMGHSGGINGFATRIIRYPDEDVVIIVLSNVQGSPVVPICRDLAAIVFGEEYLMPMNDRPSIGVVVEPAPNGVRITRLLLRSAARAAGLRVADVILKIDDVEVKSVISLSKTITRKGHGTTVVLTVDRDGKEVKVPVTLPARKSEEY